MPSLDQAQVQGTRMLASGGIQDILGWKAIRRLPEVSGGVLSQPTGWFKARSLKAGEPAVLMCRGWQ